MLDLRPAKLETGKDVQKLVVELDLDLTPTPRPSEAMLDAKSVPGVTRVAIED